MASGDTLITFPATASVPTASSFATLDIIQNFVDTATTNIAVLNFDPGANNEFAVFYGVMPGQYDGSSAIDVVLGWSAATTGTSSCKWDVSFKSVTGDADNVTSKAFAAIQTSTHAIASAAREVQYTTIPFSNAQADSVGANEYFILRVERDSADAADDLTADDAELHFVEVRLQ